MKRIYQFAAFAGLLLMASCFGQHNEAPNPGVNLDDTRIYGEKGAEPRQLKNKYEADESGEVANRAEAIRVKLFGSAQTAQAAAPVADSTATAQPAAAQPAEK